MRGRTEIATPARLTGSIGATITSMDQAHRTIQRDHGSLRERRRASQTRLAGRTYRQLRTEKAPYGGRGVLSGLFGFTHGLLAFRTLLISALFMSLPWVIGRCRCTDAFFPALAGHARDTPHLCVHDRRSPFDTKCGRVAGCSLLHARCAQWWSPRWKLGPPGVRLAATV